MIPHRLVGTEVYRSPWRQIDQGAIDAFSRLLDGEHWIHNDPERARIDSVFGGAVVQGFLLLSAFPVLRRLFDVDRPPYPHADTAILYGLNRCRFPQAVHPGQRVRGITELLEVEPARGGFRATERFTVEIDGIEKPACVAEVVLLYYLKGGAAAAG